MAKDPHEIVDFAPAWLNFNNSNKKKTEKASGIHGSSQSSLSLNPPLKSSQEPVFRTSSVGVRAVGSPSRSTGSNTHWIHQPPGTKSNPRHQSVDFASNYADKNDIYASSPSKDNKSTFPRSGTFSPNFSSSKRDFRNGETLLRQSSAIGDSRSSGLDTDFPSLSDIDISNQNKAKRCANGQSSSSAAVVNMWKKPLVLKASAEPLTPQNLTQVSKSPQASSIYKTLVPKSSSTHTKQPYRRTMSVPLNLPSKCGNSIGELITSGSKREHNAVGRFNQVSAVKVSSDNLQPVRSEQNATFTNSLSVDIGVHKKHRKGKSHFLKTLRQTESGDDSAGGVDLQDVSESDGEAKKDNHTHRMDGRRACQSHNQSLDPEFTESDSLDLPINKGPVGLKPSTYEQAFGNPIELSSSLEAEHRLLREMGWNYSDDQAMEEEPPLTEDEIQEFKSKCNGLLSAPSSGKRKEAFTHAFSEWKFSGIRKRNLDERETKANGRLTSTAIHNEERLVEEPSDLLFSDDESP